jgi:hypothetical protein
MSKLPRGLSGDTGTLASIIAAAGISPEEFSELL